jgi:hypothetical protein
MIPEKLKFICDTLPFTYHQGSAEQCIEFIKQNNRQVTGPSQPPLLVCSTGRHVAQNTFTDYYRMWTVLKYIYNDVLDQDESTLSTARTN